MMGGNNPPIEFWSSEVPSGEDRFGTTEKP
jgi:hypothetical protein